MRRRNPNSRFARQMARDLERSKARRATEKREQENSENTASEDAADETLSAPNDTAKESTEDE